MSTQTVVLDGSNFEIANAQTIGLLKQLAQLEGRFLLECKNSDDEDLELDELDDSELDELQDCEEGECDECNDPDCGCDCHEDESDPLDDEDEPSGDDEELLDDEDESEETEEDE